MNKTGVIVASLSRKHKKKLKRLSNKIMRRRMAIEVRENRV